MSDNIRIHAYTDENDLTLFAVDYPDGRRLQFGAYITNFELNTEMRDFSSMSFRSFIPGEQTVTLDALVIRPAVYHHPAPQPRPIDVVREQIAPPRKELPGGQPDA